MIGPEELDVRFTYHPPKEGQPEVYEKLRGLARDLALQMTIEVPDSPELLLAIAKLEESIMWANAGIARRS